MSENKRPTQRRYRDRKQGGRHAKELRVGFAAYRRWIALGGTHEEWVEWREFTVPTNAEGL